MSDWTTITSIVNVLHEWQVKTWPCGNWSVRSGLSNFRRGPRRILSSSGGIKPSKRWSDHPVSGSVLYGRAHRPLRTRDSHPPGALPAAAPKKLSGLVRDARVSFALESEQQPDDSRG